LTFYQPLTGEERRIPLIFCHFHRQGDPLSPYLFILVLELLSAAIKNDPEITGVKINDSEYLLSQYADDSSLILDDNPKSLAKLTLSPAHFENLSKTNNARPNVSRCIYHNHIQMVLQNA
jgi:hypothetical protein